METRTNFYRYLISKFDIIIPNEEPMKLKPANIYGFRIERDYDNLFFPIFQVKLLLDYPLYYKIIQNKTTVKFNVKLESYQYTNTEQIKFRETVFDSSFAIYTDDDNFYLDEANYKKMMDITGNQMTGGFIEFYLFKESDITSSRTVINRVLGSSNMTDALIYLLSKSNTPKVLMSPLQNTNQYSEVVLLPTTVIQNVIYLEKRYGFYRNGTIFFYDFNTVYLLSKTATANTYKTNEYKNVIIEIYMTNNNRSFTTGNYKDNTTKTYTLHINRDNLTINTKSIVSNEINGTKVNLISGESDNLTTASPNVRVRNSANDKYLVNNFDNPFLKDIIENEKVENDRILTVNAIDFDIAILGPNKQYSFICEDTKLQKEYSGNYRLSSEILMFEKNGEDFRMEASLKFKKPK